MPVDAAPSWATEAGQPAEFVHYAVGNGLGHVVRSLASARLLARRFPGRHVLIANTTLRESAAALVATEPQVTLCWLPADLTPANARRDIPLWLDALRPAALVVDTFPRGLVGELAGWFRWDCPTSLKRRWLVSRQLPTAYASDFDLLRFAGQCYSRIYVPGETSPLATLPQAIPTAPFLLRNRDELPDVVSAARWLGVDPREGAVVVAASGTYSESLAWREQCARLAERWPADLPPLRVALPLELAGDWEVRGCPCRVRHWPLIECLPAVRLLLGGAGYNLSTEARTLGIPALQVPAPRTYDDQSSRLTLPPLHGSLDQWIERIRTALLPTLPQIPAYVNGAASVGHWQ